MMNMIIVTSAVVIYLPLVTDVPNSSASDFPKPQLLNILASGLPRRNAITTDIEIRISDTTLLVKPRT